MDRFFKVILLTVLLTVGVSSLSYAVLTKKLVVQNEFEKMIASRLHTIDQDLQEIASGRSKIDKDQVAEFDKAVAQLGSERKDLDLKIDSLRSLPLSKKQTHNDEIKKDVVKLDGEVYQLKEKLADKNFGMAGILGM